MLSGENLLVFLLLLRQVGNLLTLLLANTSTSTTNTKGEDSSSLSARS